MNKYIKYSVVLFTSLFILAAGYIYHGINYTVMGIMGKEGISPEQIKLSFEPNEEFRYYLYYPDDGRGGIIALRKSSNGLGWSVYNRVVESETIESTDEGNWIKASLPTYSEDRLHTLDVYGGRVKLDSDQHLEFNSSGQKFRPTLTTTIGEYTYFFLSEPSILLEDSVQVKVVDRWTRTN
ncbi:hypothetical protein [Saccharibacillus sp. JS10]|uniref:hypothetical protein n=1 Tax=Saccharibacillus sp. JS10 TaxID=2950552 RepID=UPI00210EBEB0|nr:hypothetical protein [Saccharibacillus sp. JS10]MCQ4086572.1 hypothetical protein [Saccharibacillus sp. JS10]